MLGPGVAWYLALSGFLFGVGALGVLVRRNPLIVLLSLEIMLNGANLALIAFSRHAGNGAGQIFALAVMAVAASEVCVGLGLVVAIHRRRLALDVDTLIGAARMRGVGRWGAWICLIAPLAGAVAITIAGTRISRRTAGWLSTASVAIAFGGAVWSFFGLRATGSDTGGNFWTTWTWLQSGSFKVGLEILVDPLSTMMMLIVSGVGGLIVLYSIGYMDGDDEERRYFAYMSFFVFSMLLLVQGGNLLLLLVGWGLVGLSSYLLIGFWHERPAAVAAAKKAFVMNAIGDATMALAFFVLIAHARSLEFADAFGVHLSSTAVTLVALGLLGGAAAKSAQIPLHTWLPDAMEGPTPVSALIHAATMVTAGVYLIARTHPIFEQARTVELVAAGMGALTLLVAGLIALVQVDIKRVIAYSTMSQIGYMFLGVGLGAYSSGMFHLMTHAFFKALLFMAAGIVIHALSGEQDIRKMRGIGATDAVDALGIPRRLARARRRAAVRGLLLEGRDHRRRAARALVRRHPLGRRVDRDVPDRALHVPPLLHRLRGGTTTRSGA